MTSFSLPGLPSLLSLRMSPASCVVELLAKARLDNAAENPKAESAEANRVANVLRVKGKFMNVSFQFIFEIFMRSR
jgi:hypothetical protein